MATKRIGELLSQMVPLSPHDIEEILHEQSATRKPFGDIALSLGLCRPEHVWKAWCGQLLDGHPRRIELDSFGIDSQAVSHVPEDLAREFGLIPVRVFGDILIVAIEHTQHLVQLMTLLPERTGKQPRFVLADGAAIRRATASHYPKRQAVG